MILTPIAEAEIDDALDRFAAELASDEARARHLVQHVELEPRIDIGEKDEWRITELLGDLWAEPRENSEVGLEGLGGIQVMSVATAPAKGLSFSTLEAGQIHAARSEGLELLHGIVGPDDADELHRSEQTGSRRKKIGRAAEHVICLAERSLDGIECD